MNNQEAFLIRKIDKQIQAIDNEQRALSDNIGKTDCHHPIKDLGKTFNYLINSAYDIDQTFYNCMAKAESQNSINNCYVTLTKDILEFECQKLKKKAKSCTNKKIPKKTSKCLVMASTGNKVNKCMGKAFESTVK